MAKQWRHVDEKKWPHLKAKASRLTQVLSGLPKGAHGPGHCHGEGRKTLLAIGSWSTHERVPVRVCTDFRKALRLIWTVDI